MADDFNKDDLSWLRGDSGGDDDESKRPAEDKFDWQKKERPSGDAEDPDKRLGFTGELDWRKAKRSGASDTSEEDEEDDALFGWMGGSKEAAQQDENSLGVTGQLPWLGGSDKPDGTPAENRTGVTGELSWRRDLDEKFEEQFGRQFSLPPRPTSEQSAGDLFDENEEEEFFSNEIPVEPDAPSLFDDLEDTPQDWFSSQSDTSAPAEPDWMAEIGEEALTEEEEDYNFGSAEDDTGLGGLFDDMDMSTFEESSKEAPAHPAVGDDEGFPSWLEDMEEIGPTEAVAATTDEWDFDIQVDHIDESPELLYSESTKVEKPDWLEDLPPSAAIEDSTEPEAGLTPQTVGDDIDFMSLFGDIEEDGAQFDFGEEKAQPADDSALRAAMAEFEFEEEEEARPAASLDELFAQFDEEQPTADDDLLPPYEFTPPAPSYTPAIDSEPILRTGGEDDWLTQLGELEDFDDETVKQEPRDDLESFLASISVNNEPIEAPQAPTSSGQIDFDTLFQDPAFSEMDAEGEQMQAERPEWLKNVSVEEVSAAAMVRKQQDRPLEELPERLLALRQKSQEITTGASLNEVAPMIAAAAIPAISSELILSDAQKSHVELLKTITAAEDDAEIAVSKERRRRLRVRGRLDRLAIAVILLLAVLGPLRLDNLRFGSTPPQSFATDSGQLAIFNQIDSLPANSKVIVALEYGGTRAGEMDDLTRVIFTHLYGRGINPTLVSSDTVGYLRSEILAQEISASPAVLALAALNGTRPTAPQQAIYIPESNVGLRSFNGALVEFTGESLDSYQMIILIAENTDVIRTWAEQIQPTTRTPITYVMSVGASPLGISYAQSNGSGGYLVGFRDASTYAAMLNLALAGAPQIVVPTATETETPTAPTLTPEPTSITATPESETSATVTPDSTASTEQTATVEPTSTTAAPATATQAATQPATAQATVTAPAATSTIAAPTAAPTTSTGGTFGVIVASQPVNVRSGAGTGFAVVTILQPGTRVEILDEQEGWYEIRISEDTTGWIADFLIEIEESGAYQRRNLDNQYVGMISDISQAEAPPTATTTQDAPRVELEGGEPRWYATTFGTIAAIIVIVIGNLVGLLRKRSGR